MRKAAALLGAALSLLPGLAGAENQIIIDLKGEAPAPAPPPAASPIPRAEAPKPFPLPPGGLPGRQHVAIAARGGKTPPRLPAATPPEQNFGQLGVTLARENPIFRKPDARSPILSKPAAGHYLVVQKPVNGWYALLMADGSTGYIATQYVQLMDYRVTQVDVPGQSPTSQPGVPATASGFARSLLQNAYRYLGTPYVWGGNDARGIDCSGFVKACFAAQGVSLPRTASTQALVGQEVDFSDLRAGDRLYFSVKRKHDHTGIYIGDGYFIHSGRSAGGVVISHLSERLYARSLADARR